MNFNISKLKAHLFAQNTNYWNTQEDSKVYDMVNILQLW